MAEDTRERILAACERVIAGDGLSRFRMQRVAREAGVSIGLLAYHFGDRDGLLQAALDHVNAGAAERAARVPEASDARARLAALLCSEFGDDARIRAGSTLWNELRAAAVFAPAQAGALAKSTREWQDSVRRLIVEAGRSAADADAAALALTALVEGLSGRWLTGQIDVGEAQATVRGALAALGLEPPA
ncbi:TetR family transcriptional regulator C-terminal domain-containing protein [Leucobacter allii]|uniref:TetR/AcrR family transcriptional regulator n=1 Tax=Leucobacter allii TaxID=2932247 RepID=UPI001FD20B01|nr:TetR family transcriptional regulator [Leucobacter allii]UOR00533.1 TetR family transcriptional regulator C-terminal domain-containing protein [Leucobacter allii]